MKYILLFLLLIYLIEPVQCQYEYTNASWYGGKFHGRLTASGVIFDENELVAASPTLPFGTKVEITNITNGKSVVVTVVDRGPFKISKKGVVRPLQPHPTRGFDLSKAAFNSIADLDKGVIKVKYRILTN